MIVAHSAQKGYHALEAKKKFGLDAPTESG